MLAVLSVLMGFASISTDLYLPAMPAMEKSLNAGSGMMELTVSGYLVGFSIGQIFWGTISDRYGRRISVATGLLLFIAGSAGCALSATVGGLIICRIVQAVGACASVALSRAMVRDLYSGNQAARMLSTLITVMAIAPLIGPSVGGQLALYWGWRAIFWLLVAIGLLTLAALFTIPETLPTDKRSDASLLRGILNYGFFFRSRRFLGYAGAGAFLYVGMYAYVAGTPLAYITYHHVPSHLYGLLFALGITGIMAANIVNSRFVPRIGYDRMLLYGAVLTAVSALITGVAARTDLFGLWGLVFPLFLFASTSGFVVANSITGALDSFPERAGSVSALIGALQYGSGIIGSGVVGLFNDGTPWPMGCVIAVSGVGCLLSMGLLVPLRSNETVGSVTRS